MKLHDIVSIGNGTGQAVVLRALRRLTTLARVTAIVGVTDNGGHSGALRREMGIPSVGDIKTVISALTGETVWAQVFRHRFSEGGSLRGVSMGNLIIAALVDEGGSLYHATRRLTQAFEIEAHIVPVSDTNAQVVAELSDGTEVEGEWETIMRDNQHARIVGVHHSPQLVTRPEALSALSNARWVIICPGTLWLGTGSILAAPGIKEAINSGPKIVIAIGNALTQPGVTDGMTAKDHLEALEGMLGRKVDYYIQHSQPLPERVLKLYEGKGFKPVEDDLPADREGILKRDLITEEFLAKADRVHYDPARGYPHALRHDPARLAEVFLEIASFTPEEEGFLPVPRKEKWQVTDF